MPDGQSPETVTEDPTTLALNQAEKAWAAKTHGENGTNEETDTLLGGVDTEVAKTLLTLASELVDPVREAA